MTIIGIVSAMTVPLVVANHKPIEYAAKLKKFYNTLYNAVEMAENDYDASFSVLYSTTDYVKFFSEYLADYIKYTKTVTSGTTTFRTSATGYITASNQKPVFYLDDGTSFMLFAYGEYAYSTSWGGGYKCYRLIYDVNGDTQPNDVGRDQFVFAICSDSSTGNTIKAKSFWGLTPSTNNKTRSQLQNNCNNPNNSTTRYNNMGDGYCTALVKMDGWEFKKDSGSGDGYPIKL